MVKNDLVNTQKGFTLIEILIVVVILGILASMTLPRFLAQPEKAVVAEANQMLGAMMRGQQANIDTGGSFVAIASNTTTDWNRIGMKPLISAGVATGTGPKYDYTCVVNGGTTANEFAPSYCKAARAGTGNTNKTCQISMTGGWTAGTDYTVMANGGCTLG